MAIFRSNRGNGLNSTINPVQNLSADDFDPYLVRQEDDQPSRETSLHAQPTKAEPRQQHAGAKGWDRWASKSGEKNAHSHPKRYFKGRWGFKGLRRVYWPNPGSDLETQHDQQLEFNYTEATSEDDPRGEVIKTLEGKYVYRNEFRQVTEKYKDLAVYLSPTRAVPRRLRVQATKYVLTEQGAHHYTGDWVRNKIKGNVPSVLKVSEWALRPFSHHGSWVALHRIDGVLRLLIAAIPLQFMLALSPLTDMEEEGTGHMVDSYTDYPGHYWDWPKYATNALDRAPNSDGSASISAMHSLDVRGKSIRPRKIVLQMEDGAWRVVDAGEYPFVHYIFISYEWEHFKNAQGAKDVSRLQRLAEKATLLKMKDSKYKAYWLDAQCISGASGAESNYDVYTMCDIVRGSALVAIILGTDAPEAKLGWGSRLWTLPEGLLAPGDSIMCCHEDVQGFLRWEHVHKVEMTATFWAEAEIGATWDGGNPIRVLAEHYSGLLTLSRLELLPFIIKALASTHWSNYKADHSDLPYAVMCFLHYRLERNEEDTIFQNLARLSLSNDSDRIVERMISLLPHPRAQQIPKTSLSPDNHEVWSSLASPDQYGTRVHEITPTCDVVGVAAEDQTVVVDNARAIHIRWKNFPRAIIRPRQGVRRLLALFFVAAGLWWFYYGLYLAIAWVPFFTKWIESSDSHIEKIGLLAVSFVFVAFLLSIFSPFSVRKLYGGRVEKSSPDLTAFEGVMPIEELETIIFGNYENRLTHAPSSTPFCAVKHSRHPRERRWVERAWIDHPELVREYGRIPDSHRVFTLVDLGNLTVSVFSAERPPTVALLTGREGGMVRAVLCSWSFENDCLYKETVMRMPSTVYEAAKPKDWLKLCLQTQNEAMSARRNRAW